MPKLTEQQKRFAECYMRTFDAGKAAIEAGYSEASAPSQGSKLLKKPQVSAYIDQLSAEIQEKSEIEQAEIIQGLRKIAFAPPSQKVSNSDRLRALELLGKTLALFTENHAFEANEPEPMQMTDLQIETLKAFGVWITSRWADKSFVEYLQLREQQKRDNENSPSLKAWRGEAIEGAENAE